MAVKNTKICPKCFSKSTKKIGLRRGIQRYIYKRQTLSDLAREYKRSISWM